MTVTADEAIRRLCILTGEVSKHQNYQHAADCFCGERSGRTEDYRNEGVALAFIEAATRAAMAGEAQAAHAMERRVAEAVLDALTGASMTHRPAVDAETIAEWLREQGYTVTRNAEVAF